MSAEGSRFPTLRRSHLLMFGGAAALAASYFGLDIADAQAADVLVSPETLPDLTFDNLDRLFDTVHSPYATADSIRNLKGVVDGHIDQVNALLAQMEQVADSDAKEIVKLREMRNELSVIQSRLEENLKTFAAMERQGFSPFRINQKAYAFGQDLPTFDISGFQSSYTELTNLYKGLTYGEVLYVDKSGTLVEGKITDFLEIGKTSPLIPPTLGHRLLSILNNTQSGHEGWVLNSGAFEKASAHKEGSDHLAPLQMLNCVDIAPAADLDPKRLGEFILAARGDSSISYIQLEAGPNVSVEKLRSMLTAEWGGKISDENLKYLLSKVVANPQSSGVHIHVEFKGPGFHSPFHPSSKIIASR